MNEATAKLILLVLFIVGLSIVMEGVTMLWCILAKRNGREVPNKWERMTGKSCQPHDRTGLPTSPPPPKRGNT